MPETFRCEPLCELCCVKLIYCICLFLSLAPTHCTPSSAGKKTIFERGPTVRVAIRHRTSAGAQLSSNLQRHSVRLRRLLLLRSAHCARSSHKHTTAGGPPRLGGRRRRCDDGMEPSFLAVVDGDSEQTPGLVLIQSLRSSESWLRVGGL